MGVLLRTLRSTSQKTLAGYIFPERTDFDPGLLPLQQHVIEVMIHHLMPRGEGNLQPSAQETAVRVASQLLEHWVHCTVYPKHEKFIVKDVLSLYTEFNNMVRTRTERRTEKWKEEKVEPYIKKISNTLFDIAGQNSDFVKKQELFYDAKMSQVEWDFLEDQRAERKMYCTSFVDKKWAAGVERRRKQEQTLSRMKIDNEERKKTADQKVTLEEEESDEENLEEEEYCLEKETEKKLQRGRSEYSTLEEKKVT